jgi:adenylate cyclase
MMLPTASLGPRTIYERGLWHASRCTPLDTAAAKDLYQQAIQLDGRFVAPYIALAMVNFDEGVIYGSRPIEESVNLAVSWARRAIDLDSDDADARAMLALAILTTGRIDDAWDQVTAASIDGPELPWVQAVRGTIKLYGGAPAEGRESLLSALGLAPYEPRNAIVWTQIAISHYFEGNYNATAAAAKRAIVRYPDHPIAYRWLAMAHGQLGQAELARRSLTEAMVRIPQTFRRYATGRPVWMQAADYAHVLDGQRKAGW